MHTLARLILRGTLFVAVCLVSKGQETSPAPSLETTAAAPRTESRPPARPPATEEPTPAELLESYRFLREQLRSAQQAIVSNRLEAEEAARAQAQAIGAKLDAIKSSVVQVVAKQQDDEVRLAIERDRRDAELQRMNRLAIWIAASIGATGLLAMLIIARVQSRAMNRIADAVTAHPQLMSQQAWLPSEPGAQTVDASNRRLQSAIDRIDRRIVELEQIGDPPDSPRRSTLSRPVSSSGRD